MIVNPQLFSYKIIIVSMVLVFSGCAVFAYHSYNSYESQQRTLKQEKKLVEHELSQMIMRYDDLSQTNFILSQQLDIAKQSTRAALNNVRLMKDDFSIVTQIKSRLSALKSENMALSKTTDSLNTLSHLLESEIHLSDSALGEQKIINDHLSTQNHVLCKTVEKASLITANSLKVIAHKNQKEESKTLKAGLTNRIDVCFSLSENHLALPGLKDIYIQILNPLNNVIGNKGAVEFGKNVLVYSDKLSVDYKNESIPICTTVNATKNDKPFSKGTYYVSVFHGKRKLGSTQILLN